MKNDTISRQAAIEAIASRDETNGTVKVFTGRQVNEILESLPSAELERLTDDDFETIRILLSAIKEKLCNQHRWEEAEEYERLIERFMAFASAKPKTGKWIVYKAPDKYHCGLVKCPFCEEEMIAEADEYNYCPNCGAKMVREEGEEE